MLFLLCILIIILNNCNFPVIDNSSGKPESFNMPQATITERILNITYETGTSNDGETELIVQGYEEYSCTVSSSYERVGSYSIRYELYDTDGMVEGGTRAETSAINIIGCRYNEGDAFYYGFSIFIPADWQNDEGNEDIIFQWKHTGKGPDCFIGIKREEFVYRINNDDYAYQYHIADLAKDRWNDFIVYIDWSCEYSGRNIIWYKSEEQNSYQRTVDLKGANMYTPLESSFGYFKWGLYCPKWNDSNTTLVSHRIIFHDNIRTGGTFEQVDPSK
ncbi:MAG: polysaccharide lyase [Spirochaetes bacterium]|nr:polysaccharide lyase [Spirochaetota bacterium]